MVKAFRVLYSRMQTCGMPIGFQSVVRVVCMMEVSRAQDMCQSQYKLGVRKAVQVKGLWRLWFRGRHMDGIAYLGAQTWITAVSGFGSIA